MEPEKRKGRTLSTIIVAVVCIAVVVILATTIRVTSNDTGITIKGMYGTTIPYDTIVTVQLYDKELPWAWGMTRINGISLVFMEMGYYMLKDLGRVRLAILKREAPYVLIETNKEKVLIGLGREKNQELYDRILEKQALYR